MAGGGMGAMPQGGGQQGSIVGMPVGSGMGNPMGARPGMAGGLGMSGMGVSGGQPGMGFGQGPGYGIDNYGGQQAPQMPQGDTFQPQGNRPAMNMQQMSQLLNNFRGGQMPQQQVVQQPVQQPMMRQPALQQSTPQGGMPTANLQQMSQMLRGLPVGGQTFQPSQQGIAGLQQGAPQLRSRLAGRYTNPIGTRR